MLCQPLLYSKVTLLYTYRLSFFVFFSIMVYHSRCYVYLIVSSWCCSMCSSFHCVSCELQVSPRCLISFKLDSQDYVPGTLHIVKHQKRILVSLNFSWSLLLKIGIRFSGCVLYAKYFAELSYLKSQNNFEERRWISLFYARGGRAKKEMNICQVTIEGQARSWVFSVYALLPTLCRGQFWKV